MSEGVACRLALFRDATVAFFAGVAGAGGIQSAAAGSGAAGAVAATAGAGASAAGAEAAAGAGAEVVAGAGAGAVGAGVAAAVMGAGAAGTDAAGWAAVCSGAGDVVGCAAAATGAGVGVVAAAGAAAASVGAGEGVALAGSTAGAGAAAATGAGIGTTLGVATCSVGTIRWTNNAVMKTATTTRKFKARFSVLGCGGGAALNLAAFFARGALRGVRPEAVNRGRPRFGAVTLWVGWETVSPATDAVTVSDWVVVSVSLLSICHL